MTAVVTRDVDAVQSALKAGVDPNSAHQNDPRLGRSSNTVLGTAVEMGEAEIVEALLKAGALTNVKHEIELESRFVTLDLIQLSIMKGSIPILRLLLNSGATPSMSSWVAAFKHSNLEAARMMYKRGARIPRPETLSSISALSFLPPDPDFVRSAIAELGISGEQVPWLQLVRDGAYKKLDLFIGSGLRIKQGLYAPEHELPQFLRRVAMIANPSDSDIEHARQGVERLLAAGADPRAVTPEGSSDAGAAPIHYAVAFGDPGVVERLVGSGIDPNQLDGAGRTPLMLIAGRGAPLNVEKYLSDREDIVKLLLSAGANINFVSQHASVERSGETALVQAFPNVEIARLLLQYGADPNIKLKNGETALFKVATSPAGDCAKMGEIVDLLLQSGADSGRASADGELPIHRALDPGKKRQYCEASVERLLQADSDFNQQRSSDGVTPFMLFVRKFPVERIARLVQKSPGLAVNLVDDEGRTALFHYVFGHDSGDPNEVDQGFKLFARLGADLNHRDNEGRTALNHGAKTAFLKNRSVEGL